LDSSRETIPADVNYRCDGHRSVGKVVDKELLPVVLVIEDDQDIQAILDEVLRDGGFEPAIAGSGEEAVTLLKAFGSNYRALVTDIKLMGRLDGWRVARAAREVDPAFPIVYITGAVPEEWPVHGVPNSVLLKKPFASEQLVAALSQLINAPVPRATSAKPRQEAEAGTGPDPSSESRC
jgi:DNA-binding response OmpR family regulator